MKPSRLSTTTKAEREALELVLSGIREAAGRSTQLTIVVDPHLPSSSRDATSPGVDLFFMFNETGSEWEISGDIVRSRLRRVRRKKR